MPRRIGAENGVGARTVTNEYGVVRRGAAASRRPWNQGLTRSAREVEVGDCP